MFDYFLAKVQKSEGLSLSCALSQTSRPKNLIEPSESREVMLMGK